MTEKRFVDYFDKDHNYIIQDLQNEDEYQVGFVNCDEDVFLELINRLSDENEQLKQELNISELLEKEVKIDIKHICLNITTVTDIYNLCFIDFEDMEKLGVYVTGEDGHERFLIIYKEHIVSLQVVYENDITLIEDVDVMVG